jgi:nucleotide-binding universal stress UspA family protein
MFAHRLSVAHRLPPRKVGNLTQIMAERRFRSQGCGKRRQTMRSILVQAGHDAGMTARLDTALAIARARQGHVTVLVDTPVAGYITADPYGGSLVASDAMVAALEADDRFAGELCERLRPEDVPFDVVQDELEPVDALASAARLADLVVVSRGTGLAGALALAAGCPVLALPDGTAMPFPLERVCIAWDGSDAAARALRGAVPLLAGCAGVTVLTVTRDAPGGFPPTEALRYLARHGVKAELAELARGASVEQTLADEIARRSAQLLVMGAYGHSRVREFLFGGVTRYLLEDSGSPPLLLAH